MKRVQLWQLPINLNHDAFANDVRLGITLLSGSRAERYVKVFDGETPADGRADAFDVFNGEDAERFLTERPEFQRFRNMGSIDVLVMDGQAHLCLPIGWADVTDAFRLAGLLQNE